MVETLKIDLGCGKNKQPGFVGVDELKFDGVDLVHDLKTPWPWADASVDEAYSSHFIEHLTGKERCHFVSELWRVLKPGAKATIIAPHWSSGRAYGDPTHAWPPIAEFWFYYLSKAWRKDNAPHDEELFKCDFEATWGYSTNPAIQSRNMEYQQNAISFYREAIMDIHATLTKKT